MTQNPIIDHIQTGGTTYDIEAREVTNSNASSSESQLAVWSGTQQQYDAIITKDPATVYYITNQTPGQASGVIDQNNNSRIIKTWTGTKQQYDVIPTKDADTLYNVTDEPNNLQNLLETIYPVGSIYIGTMSICPLSALFGTWQLVAQNRVLQGADENHTPGTIIEAGLPNITGQFNWANAQSAEGCFKNGTFSGGYGQGTAHSDWKGTAIDASLSNSIYGNSDTVQPPAFVVNIWQRIA